MNLEQIERQYSKLCPANRRLEMERLRHEARVTSKKIDDINDLIGRVETIERELSFHEDQTMALRKKRKLLDKEAAIIAD